MRTNSSKCVVFAYSEVGYVCLEEMIRQDADIVAVFTHIDDPDENIWFRSSAELAAAHGIPVYRVDKMKPEDVRLVVDAAPDFIFSFYFRSMIPKAVLDSARCGAYNMHGALLPKNRGRACINWAVINGETETGATLHVMTDRPDSGDIVSQRSVPITSDDTAYDVFIKVTEAAREIIRDELGDIFAGTIILTPQDETRATVLRRRTPADGQIDWTRGAKEIYNLIRGVTHPFPGAFTELDGRKLYIWKARIKDNCLPQFSPGTLVTCEPMMFAAADGMIELVRWQFDGEEEETTE